MTLQFIEGFDLYQTGDLPALDGNPWSLASGTAGGVSITVARNGTRSLRMTNGNSTAVRSIGNPSGRIIVGSAWREERASSNPTSAGFARVEGSSSNLNISRASGTTEYQLRRGTSVIASLGVHPINTWHYLFMDIDVTNGLVDVYVNRALVASAVSFAALGTIGSIGYAMTRHAAEIAFDDIFVWNDPTSDERTALLAALDFAVIYSIPSADGTPQDWTSTQANGFSAINQTPPSGSRYIEAASVNDVSAFSFSDISSGVFGVFGAQAYTYALKTTAGAGSIQFTLNGGAGGVKALATTAAYYMDIYTVNPATTDPWLPGDLASLGGSYERVA